MGRHKKRISSKPDTVADPASAAPNTTTTIPDLIDPTVMTLSDTENGADNDVQPNGDVESNAISEVQSSEPSPVIGPELADETPTELLNASHVAGVDEDDNTNEKLDILGNGLITKQVCAFLYFILSVDLPQPQVIEKGLGRETRPNHGDVVTVSYKCWLDEDDTLVEDVPELTFTLGDGDVIHGTSPV